MQAYEMNKVGFEFASEDDAFPALDPGVQPFGSRIVVQVRRPKAQTKGGIYLPGDVKDTEQWNTQVAKVRAVGPLAFCNRNTGQKWPEGDWCQPGDFIRVPKYGGDSWSVTYKPEGEDAVEIVFKIFNDLDVIGKVTGDPLAMKAFI